MTFFLYQNEETLGPYSREDTLNYIREGLIAAQDLLFPEGAEDWVPAQDTFPQLFTSGFKLHRNNAKDESGPIELKVAPNALVSPSSLEPVNATMRIAVPPKKSVGQNATQVAASARSAELKKQTRKATQSISGVAVINGQSNARRATADLSALLQEKKGFLSRIFGR